MFLAKLDRWGKRINRRMDRVKGISVAFLFFAFIAAFAVYHRAFGFYNDAKLYYIVSEQFIDNGRISFVSYHDILRAYTWPFILLPVRVFAGWMHMDPALLFRLVFGLVSGVFFGILLPNGIEKVFKIKVNFLQRLLFAGLLLLFWAPTFLQALTDMPAFMFNIYGIILIFYALDAKKLVPRWLLAALAGFLLAGTSLLRPVYQFSLYLGVVLLAVQAIQQKQFKRLWLAVPLFLGAAIMFAPQVAINQTNFGFLSPYAQAQDNLDGRLLRQMTIGLVSNGSTGYIGEKEITLNILNLKTMAYAERTVVGPQMCFFQNPHGVVLYEKLGSSQFASYGQYFKSALSYPFDFISIWFTHLFFGLDLKFPWLYNLTLKPASVLYSLANYTVIYLVLRALLKRKWSRQTWLRNTIGVLIIVIPSLIALMVNMEERFMIPVHMIIYMVAAYSVPLQNWALSKPKLRWGDVAAYAGFVVFCFAYSARILSALSLTLQ